MRGLARPRRLVALALVVAAALFAVVLWWVADDPRGDGLFHLGRARKLEAVDPLTSVGVVNEFL